MTLFTQEEQKGTGQLNLFKQSKVTRLDLSTWDRKPMFENSQCEQVGLFATCNCCDRVIYEDENYRDQYIESGGYCKECNSEREEV